MQSFPALCLWSQGASPTQYSNVCPNQEAAPSFGVQSFYWCFVIWAQLIKSQPREWT